MPAVKTATVHQADAPPDRAATVLVEQVDELVRRLGRVGTDSQRPGEHVRRTPWHHGDRGPLANGSILAAVAEDAVDHFVHRAVAAVHDHHVDAVACRVPGDLDGVTAVVGVGDRQADPALQRVREEVASGGSGRRRVRVHDQHGAHGT
jgi:hypothetical protein